jgi:hypothetical protein
MAQCLANDCDSTDEFEAGYVTLNFSDADGNDLGGSYNHFGRKNLAAVVRANLNGDDDTHTVYAFTTCCGAEIGAWKR